MDGQALSTSALIASMTSKPLAEFRLGNAFFSPLNALDSSSNMDASQPYVPNGEKKNSRSVSIDEKFWILQFLANIMSIPINYITTVSYNAKHLTVFLFRFCWGVGRQVLWEVGSTVC